MKKPEFPISKDPNDWSDLSLNEIDRVIEHSKKFLEGHPVSIPGKVETHAIIMALIDMGYIELHERLI